MRASVEDITIKTAHKDAKSLDLSKVRSIARGLVGASTTVDKSHLRSIDASFFGGDVFITAEGQNLSASQYKRNPTSDTTGASRREVFVEVYTGKPKSTKNGFFWDGKHMIRQDSTRNIYQKAYPSIAFLLGGARAPIMAAVAPMVEYQMAGKAFDDIDKALGGQS